MGTDASVEEMITKADQTTLTLADVAKNKEAVPAHNEILRLFSSLRKRKTFGEDSLPPELFALHSEALPDILHPVMCKACLSLREPLPWRGGMLT